MKKTLTFIIFFCFISIQIAFAANWVPVFINNQRKVYLDTLNLQVNGDISTYWIKYISEGFTYKLYLSSDCSNNEISTLQFLKYNSSDELIYSNKNETGYNKVVPGTIEEDIHKRVCSGNPYKKYVNDAGNIYVNSLSNDIGILDNGTVTKQYNNVDFSSYMSELQRRIKMNWDPPRNEKNKRVVVLMKIAKNGRLLSVKILRSSDSSNVDKAALNAVELTAPFRPLPSGFIGNSIDINFTFDYNTF